MTLGWKIEETVNDVQILPALDAIGHELSQDCICGPEVEQTTGCPLVVHNSLDGRELVRRRGN